MPVLDELIGQRAAGGVQTQDPTLGGGELPPQFIFGPLYRLVKPLPPCLPG